MQQALSIWTGTVTARHGTVHDVEMATEEGTSELLNSAAFELLALFLLLAFDCICKL